MRFEENKIAVAFLSYSVSAVVYSYSQQAEENGALGTALAIGSGSQPQVELSWGQAGWEQGAGDALRALLCPTLPH